jgi:predicted CoA-substrate-specific enzyme activase
VITAGIDVGAENTKAVIVIDNKVLGYSVIRQGMDAILLIAESALSEAAGRAGITTEQIEYLISTGTGSEYVWFSNEQATEAASCARAAEWLRADTDTVIDIGADKCLVVKCQRGKPFRTARNDRCAAGAGRFLEIAAKPLGIDVDELGKLSLQSNQDVGIESICAVFAESEIISLVHKRARAEDIAKAVFKALSNRIYTLVLKVGFERNLAMVGGIANNMGMVKALEEKTGYTIFVPQQPIIAGAIGAALIAFDRKMAGLQ